MSIKIDISRQITLSGIVWNNGMNGVCGQNVLTCERKADSVAKMQQDIAVKKKRLFKG